MTSSPTPLPDAPTDGGYERLADVFASRQAFWSFITLKGVNADRLTSIVEMTPVSALVTGLNLALMGFALYRDVSPHRMTIWACLSAAVVLMMVRSWWRLRGRTFPRTTPRAVRASAFSAVITALPWSVLMLFVAVDLTEAQQMMTYTVMGGAVAGGGLVLSRVPIAGLIYGAMLLGPAAVQSLLAGDAAHFALFGFICIYGAFIVLLIIHNALLLLLSERSRDQLMRHMDDLDVANQRIERLARIDPVTDLMNRLAFQQELEHAIARAQGEGESLTLFLIDLDHFKSVNDALGHNAGDVYLHEAGRRIQAVSNDRCKLFRIGGDEFAVLIEGMANALDVIWTGQRLIAELSRPVTISGHVMQGGASVGVAQSPKHTLIASELMTFADDALLEAKESGRGVVALFDSARKDRIRELAAEAELLMHGIGHGAIVMMYQPQIDLRDGTLAGFEALVRWRHPERGILAPDNFLALAEDKGLILELCDAIMKRVNADIRAWREAGLDPVRMSINVHPIQLKHPERFLQHIDQIARDAGGAERIVVEITEDCVVGRGTEAVPKIMKNLLGRGFKVSLDDFGTGFASLSHIKDLPITELKIDRSFTNDMLSCDKSHAIVKAVYDMARPREIEVVAEGIETEAHRDALRALGGSIGQGYFYARPLSVEAVTQALAEQRWNSRPIAEQAAPLRAKAMPRSRKRA